MSARARTIAAALAIVAAGWPALGQERPESLLPPGFGEPVQPAPPRPAATPAPGATPGAGTAVVQPLPTGVPSPSPSATPSATPTIAPEVLAQYRLPNWARRSLDRVGPIGAGEGGIGPDAFGSADGRYLERLMRRTAAPVPSRWLSILLRRTLLSQLDTPAHVNGADFAAERAWLLLRMGEPVAARAVVQSVDPAHHTPKLLQVALNASLAAGDPGGLCPLFDRGMALTGERGWTMAQAMCAGLAGQPQRAGALVRAARRQHVASGVDLLLAQKVVGAGAQGRQGITIEWAGVDRLTVWRFGLAAATGVAIPPELVEGAGAQVRLWQATSPTMSLVDRIAPAEAAAAQGVLSSEALIDFYAALAADDDAPSGASAAAEDLRLAYSDPSNDARATALTALWTGAGDRSGYARLVLTARAAAGIAPRRDLADRAIASMLAAGLDRSAMRWRGVAAAGSDGWAMLALADPDAIRRWSYGDLADYQGSGNAALKQRLLFAGLAGLGRLSPDDVARAGRTLGVDVARENSWTRALDRAVRAEEPATVAVLAAIGMQTPDWRGVPPEALYRIVAALGAVGLEGEARMIAAEAIARA